MRAKSGNAADMREAAFSFADLGARRSVHALRISTAIGGAERSVW
jgi:hypothetical protein